LRNPFQLARGIGGSPRTARLAIRKPHLSVHRQSVA
jgi:hypothetical protein